MKRPPFFATAYGPPNQEITAYAIKCSGETIATGIKSEADALAFAAAPELLAQVENLISLALAFGVPDNHVSLAKATAAIAKATGNHV